MHTLFPLSLVPTLLLYLIQECIHQRMSYTFCHNKIVQCISEYIEYVLLGKMTINKLSISLIILYK